MEQRGDAVRRWIKEEEFKFAEKIKKEVWLLLSPHKYALPPRIVLGRPAEQTKAKGRYIGRYTKYDTESQDLFEVTEEYFDSESKPPIRVQLSVTAWIWLRDQVIDTAMAMLKSKKPTQSQ